MKRNKVILSLEENSSFFGLAEKGTWKAKLLQMLRRIHRHADWSDTFFGLVFFSLQNLAFLGRACLNKTMLSLIM
jgi:hypothetical protein